MFNQIVKISTGAAAGTKASQQKNFYLQDISDEYWVKLPAITQAVSYSAIEFLDNIRTGENFIQAHLIILDFDDGMTIEEALLKFAQYYGMIATTKSHQLSIKNGKAIDPIDKFRLMIFLKEPITDPKVFKTLMTNLITKFGADQACKDLARFYFPNPTQQHWWLLKATGYFDITPYMTEVKNTSLSKDVPSNSKAITTSIDGYVAIGDDWEITSEDGTTATALQWRDELKTGDNYTVHCPFPEHNDRNPSAFIEKKENGSLFAYCNSCTKKGWNSQKRSKVIIPDEIITNNKTNDNVQISEFSNALIQCLRYVGECKVNEIVDYIISTDIPITSYNTNLYLYVDGYWKKHKNDDIEKKVFIKAALKKILGDRRPSRALIESVHGELAYEHLDLPETSSIMINFADSILMIDNGEFHKIPHDPKHRKLYKLKFPYDEYATCPTVDKFMFDVVGEQEAINLLWEFIGSCFISNDLMKLEKCVFLYGAGSNGKSVFLDLIRELFGRLNISTVSLKDMGNAERRHSMIGKLLNIASEGSANKFDSEDLKAIISREPLPVRQLYNNAIDTDDFPRLIVATNNLPYTGGDTSHGVLRRIEVVPFDNIIPEERQDKQLLQKLTPELSGVMNRVLQGMTRLLNNQRLTKSQKVEEAKRAYERQIDPVKFFVDEFKISYEEAEPIYSSTDLYEKFRVFCQDSGINALNKQNFSKHMSSLYGKLQHSNTLYGWRVIVGVEVNSHLEAKNQESPYG